MLFDETMHKQLISPSHLSSLGVTSMSSSRNKFVYVKHNFAHGSTTEFEPVKVLVNPNFNKKVFINPNFNTSIGNTGSSIPLPKIHINPNMQNIKLGSNDCENAKKIHVNPKVLRAAPASINDRGSGEDGNKGIKLGTKETNCTIISTRTKLVRLAAKNIPDIKIKKRRSSIRSQFKIIKSSLLEKSICNENKIQSKQRLIKLGQKYAHSSKDSNFALNKFKLDNRHAKTVGMSPRSKKYVYISKFLNITDIARNNLLKQNKSKLHTLNIEGVLYKKSPNSLKRTSNAYKKANDVNRVQDNGIKKSKYKFTRKSFNVSLTNNVVSKQSKYSIFRRRSVGRNTSKMRVCNIPCPYYRKFGRCKGKENGKCGRKHDPDQIALCTKFLQGACIDKKCLLSHNVSPEKMPTCKFYLEGSCSREDCPYLHVRISPKADVCRDFLEGFCKKAAECDKRHQLLCPDYEKNGKCLKQRCPYPHGIMVRKYSVFNKTKFAKKSSNNCTTKVNVVSVVTRTKSENLISAENNEGNVKSRYYIGQTILDNEEKNQISDTNQNDYIGRDNDQEKGVKCRPQLGKLPSFIAFENI